MANLFKKAASKSASEPKKAKDEKVRIKIEDPSFFDKVQKLEQLNDVLKSTKAKADMISDELRDLGRDEWANLYSKMGKNPGTVVLEHVNDSNDTSQLQFIPTDGYIKISADRADELRDTYGEEVVEEKTTFGFDSTMIEKYGEILSRLIEECGEIAEKDKEKIITATTAFSVAKGTIDNLSKLGDVKEVMEAVKPIVALKNIEVIKG
jgi:hypothetical protein